VLLRHHLKTGLELEILRPAHFQLLLEQGEHFLVLVEFVFCQLPGFGRMLQACLIGQLLGLELGVEVRDELGLLGDYELLGEVGLL